MKDRVLKLGYAFNKKHPTIDLEAPYLGFGLEEDIQKWIDEVPNPRLIVIDTLAELNLDQKDLAEQLTI